MNEQLTELAERLDVAVEVLWGALITQAPISATFEIIGITLFIGFSLIGLKRLNVKAKTAVCEIDRQVLFVLFWISTLCFMLINLALFSGIGTTIAAFINPEYWALKQIT